MPPVLRTLASAAAVLTTMSGVAAPPGTDPDDGDPSLERKLAELSFGIFLTVDLGAQPDVFTCTEPTTARRDETVTCFGLIDGTRIVIATTTSSGATGAFDFEVIADYGIVDPSGVPPVDADPAVTTVGGPTAAVESVPPTYSVDDRNQANVAILLYGDEVAASAASEIAAIVEATDGAVTAVNAWAWDAASATFTVDINIDPNAAVTADDAAWAVVTELGVHWRTGQPFRNEAASIKPNLVIVVSGRRFVSNWDLMAQVADGDLTRDKWLVAAQPA